MQELHTIDNWPAAIFGRSQRRELRSPKLRRGSTAGAVEADDGGGGGLGENRAVQIADDQEDGNFLRDAGSEAHNLPVASRKPERRGEQANSST